MRFVLFALVAASLVVAETSGTELHLLPAVRASLSLGSSLLRHVADVKDILRQDIDRRLFHSITMPDWNFHALQLRPWAKPSYHGSFSYQASAYGGLPALPLPFFPRPRPVIMLVPCRDVRTPIANFVFPCIRIIRGNEAPHAVLGSSQAGQVTGATTTDGLLNTTPTYGTDWTGAQQVTDVVTRAADITSTPATYETTEAATTPATGVTTTLDLVTRADDVSTVPESPDTGVSAQDGSTVEPTIERRANTIPAQTDTPTTTEQPLSVPSSHFNDLLKNSMFGKLKEASTVDRKADIVPAQNPTTTEQPPPVTLSRYHYLLMKKYKEQ